jgi:hypothetical protein
MAQLADAEAERIWQYQEPDADGTVLTITMTEQQIIVDYYLFWCDQMQRAGQDAFTREGCIEDWVVAHWAYEVVPS